MSFSDAQDIQFIGQGGELTAAEEIRVQEIQSLADTASDEALGKQSGSVVKVSPNGGGSGGGTWGSIIGTLSDQADLQNALNLKANLGSAGTGDVVGPATNSDNYIPLWDGADSKTLKNGIVDNSSTWNALVSFPGFSNLATDYSGDTPWTGLGYITDISGQDLSTADNSTSAFITTGDLSGLVPYTGATGDVDLGGYNLSNVNNIAGSGIEIDSLGHISFFSDAGVTLTGDITNLTDGNYTFLSGNVAYGGILDFSGITTADKTFTFPNATGTVTLTSDLAAYALTGHNHTGVYQPAGSYAAALSGTLNEIAYFNTTTTIASLAVATYPSLTELAYVKGVTSAIQTQINAKGVGDMTLAGVQSVTGLKTFDTTKLAVKGSSTGTTAIASANSGATGYTQTLQARDGTIANLDNVTYIGTTSVALNRASDALTLAGITLTTPDIGTPSAGTLTNCTGLPEAGLLDNAVTLAKMAGGTDGNLITYDAAGDPAYVATGDAGQVLTSNGAGAAPTFQAASGGGSVVSIVPIPAAATSGETTRTLNVNTTGSFFAFVLPFAITVNKLTFEVTAVTTAGTLDIGIYSENGQTKQIDITTANIALGGEGLITTAVGSVVLAAGVHYFCVVPNSNANIQVRAWTVGSLRALAAEPTLSGTKAVTDSTLPATFTPSDLTGNSTAGVEIRLDN